MHNAVSALQLRRASVAGGLAAAWAVAGSAWAEPWFRVQDGFGHSTVVGLSLDASYRVLHGGPEQRMAGGWQHRAWASWAALFWECAGLIVRNYFSCGGATAWGCHGWRALLCVSMQAL